MRGTLAIYRNIFGTYEDPIATVEIDDLNLRMRTCGGSTGGREADVRDRLLDEDGVYATDFEHDGASKLSITLAVLNEQIIHEDWFEVTGVITEARAWSLPFKCRRDKRDAEGPWDGEHDCEVCKGQHEDAEPHKMVENYVPPEVSHIEIADGKCLPVNGRFAVLRWSSH